MIPYLQRYRCAYSISIHCNPYPLIMGFINQ